MCGTFLLLEMFIPLCFVGVGIYALQILRLGVLPLPHFLWALPPIVGLANLLADPCEISRVGRMDRVTESLIKGNMCGNVLLIWVVGETTVLFASWLWNQRRIFEVSLLVGCPLCPGQTPILGR